MRDIKLNIEGPNSLEKNYIKNNSFSHVTGNQIRLLPFKTNPSGDKFGEDFKSFQGIVGELFRVLNNKSQVEVGKNHETLKIELKETIIKNAVGNVDTEHIDELSHMLSKLFFDEDDGLIKFNLKTLSYMNFINSHKAIKDVARYIFDLFMKEDFSAEDLKADDSDENLLNQLMLQSLPELSTAQTISDGRSYHNLFAEIKQQFVNDFKFLKNNDSLLLKHSEDFFKYYYFHYLSQVMIIFNDFGSSSPKVRPINFTMDWETLSESRLSSHTIGWKHLNKYSHSIFAHVNTLELLNYVQVDGIPLKDYHNIKMIYDSLDLMEQQEFKRCLDEVSNFYTKNITVFDTGKNWEHCEYLLNMDLYFTKLEDDILKAVYALWFKIRYQFENSPRSKPYSDYSKWYSHFVKVNYTKNRGRLGHTTVLSQELLLFLTRLCIGNEDKIRLKLLWDRLRERGVLFDETSKLEIIKLFEKINLIEKKSDSGDAQYVKSTI
ncbi:DNA phosphorothioation-dependent restriction protein DptG [Chryseobacterium sp. VAUSW3]|uniref:DNA phosphorothioation-dependent restriction protein DptG n=1 Tax=Chryseobacterium sp. VAUSW3 TaxID=2010998 RepID=UPI000B4DAD0E|nr:DNA phosphorothioation-dependent restriction protein DptG [Chryseobacterium sp. VAUSW3]OWR13756.1 DNA phosphorothioation-dependent restriction protein DptG [Chryseobacterium sp. VAUSW3]